MGRPEGRRRLSGDPYTLQRFVDAQSESYDQALAELRRGRKTGHWIWFVFPQIAGLGRSGTAQLYAITSLDEARAYLAHPLLGARLRECVAAVNAQHGLSAHDIFGSPDDLKFRSSLTLFAKADPNEPLFADALAKYYGGRPDALTLEKLGG